MTNTKIPIIIAGPTAGGKTDIALALARLLGGEIISVDSRQVYKNLAAGTASPAGVWQNGVFSAGGVPYHLVDFLDIAGSFDVGRFCAAARAVIDNAPQKQFIFAGGTGMYLQGFFSGMDALPAASPALRAELGALGKEALHARLSAVDAPSAATIPPGNRQRVMRALEIYLLSGRPASELRTGKFAPQIAPSKAKFFYLDWDKEDLNARIAARTQAIFAPMAVEARQAIAAGYAPGAQGLRSLGYREAIAWLRGEITQEAAIERITTLTRQYAKRQRTWFARYREAIKISLRPGMDPAQIAQKIAELI